jgi:hypothetical protein
LTHHGRRRGAQVLVSLLASLGIAIGISATPALASSPTLRISPATSSVSAVGGTVTVNVIVSSPSAIQGAQATVTFDKSLLQITSVTRGAEWANADLFLGAATADIAKANSTGSLANVAATNITSTVAAGDSGFLAITFKAIACGTATLGLPVFGGSGQAVGGLLLSSSGATVKVTATGGTVGVCSGSASPGASASAGASGSDLPSGSPGDSSAPGDSSSPGASSSDMPSAYAGLSAAPGASAAASSGPVDLGVTGTGGSAGGGSTLLVVLGAAIVVAAAGVGVWILRRPTAA